MKYYEYSDFKIIERIGNGSFGSVSRANWKDTEIVLALKSFNNQASTLKEVVNELKLHIDVNFHENIIKFCGITKKKTDKMSDYILVLEYANNGTLKTYLKEHFNELGWNDKLELALQLSNAILCLHESDIIHLHQKKIKLADFGLSRKIAETSSSENYVLNKKSDVYSIGVIMWQISSGYRTFYDIYPEGIKYDTSLMLAIQKECWKDNPVERPDVREIVSKLQSISFKRGDTFINANEEIVIMDNLSKQEISDMNYDLLIDNISKMIGSKSSLCLQANESVPLNTMEPVNHLSISSTNSSNSFELAVANINNLFINNLNQLIIKKHDKGTTFDIIQKLVNQQMLQLNRNIDKLVENFRKNQFKIDWEGRIGRGSALPNENQIMIISKFERKEIFNHKYDVNDIFNYMYKFSLKPRRHPNSFLIFRIVFGLVATDKNIKLGNGAERSTLAGLVWRGANESEKSKFENMSLEFKQLHKKMFPNYEYIPRRKIVTSFPQTVTSENFYQQISSSSFTAPYYLDTMMGGLLTTENCYNNMFVQSFNFNEPRDEMSSKKKKIKNKSIYKRIIHKIFR
ncbi:kinase-like domain-containing protein [Rhizophagus clarus]|uniref:Kinase-like domain-containing protein n=1 Tax=Rhizophagus clarus TaxID=94130 RepID=A0A8H3QD04_9GLOM|nr:kinase-like domain-containing protein [Rhizophagus clarus]